jgi:hypothetical protein
MSMICLCPSHSTDLTVSCRSALKEATKFFERLKEQRLNDLSSYALMVRICVKHGVRVHICSVLKEKKKKKQPLIFSVEMMCLFFFLVNRIAVPDVGGSIF